MNVDTLTTLLFLLIPFTGILLLYLLTNAYFLRLGKFPLKSFTFRQTAQSTQQALNQQRQIYFVLLFFIPLMFVLSFYTLHINGFSLSTIVIKVVLALYALIIMIALFLLLRCIRQINYSILAIQAQLGMAHLLSATAEQGFTVHHDTPIGKQAFIPHLIVGPAGVFLVNLLIHGRPFFSQQGESIRAKYINQRFIFPNGQNKKIIKATEYMAINLQVRLSKLVGKKVPVKAILTLPGWYLEKKEKAPIIILPIAQAGAFISSFADKKRFDEFTVEKINECIINLSTDSL